MNKYAGTPDFVRIQIARWVSSVLNPIVLAPLMFFFLLSFEPVYFVDKTYLAVIILVFFSLVPLGVLLVFKKLKLITSLDVFYRERRHLPYIFGIASYIVGGLLLLSHVYWEGLIASAVYALIGTSTMAALINYRFKISNHNAAASVSATYLLVATIMYGSPVSYITAFLVSILLVVLMIWSRVAVGAHTFYESISGSVLGFCIAAISIILVIF